MMNSWFGSGLSDGGWIVMGASLAVVVALISTIIVLTIRSRPR